MKSMFGSQHLLVCVCPYLCILRCHFKISSASFGSVRDILFSMIFKKKIFYKPRSLLSPVVLLPF